MRYKMTNTEFRDWLAAYLKIMYPAERFLIYDGPWGASRVTIVERFEDDGEETIWQGPGEDGYHYQLSVMEGGFIFSFTLTLVTPEIVDLELLIYPSTNQPGFPRDAATAHADALTAAIDKRFRGVAAMPTEPGPNAPLDAWFQWRKDCKTVGVIIGLQYIAGRTSRSIGYVKQLHAAWKQENT